VRAALVAALALVGCSLARRPPDIRYYTFAVPGAPPPASVALTVGRFTADEPYATPHLAHRTSPYRIEYYVFHRWAGDPRWIVASAARDYLERATRGAAGGSYELTGNVRRLEEVDEPAGCQAQLTLDLRVERDGQVVLVRSYATEIVVSPAPSRVPLARSRTSDGCRLGIATRSSSATLALQLPACTARFTTTPSSRRRPAHPASSARAITLSSRIGFTPSKIGRTSASTTWREIANSSA
jgi:ABC-type uncharacterized transport system auxiliary subunit